MTDTECASPAVRHAGTALRRTGRPTLRCAETEGRLEHVFALGGTVAAACFHAGIGVRTFMRWQAEDEEFRHRIEAVRQVQVLRALRTISDNLDDVATASWYLERRHEDFRPTRAARHLPAGQSCSHVPVRSREPAV